jgi:HSP20 family protein
MLNNLFAKKSDFEETEADDYAPISAWAEEKNQEGQLAIDVYQTPSAIVVKSTIAGVKPEDLKISLHNGLLSIKGKREEKLDIKEEDYFYKECYWGSFSRSIILPTEVDNRKVDAVLENGVLTITLNKIDPRKIEVATKD